MGQQAFMRQNLSNRINSIFNSLDSLFLFFFSGLVTVEKI